MIGDALDLAAQYKELGDVIRGKINEDFKTYGIEVTKFYVENISLPPEVEAAMDKRASMGALGDANRYMQFQAADALRDAAQNEGGGAGLGAGLGAGFAVGNQMANAFGGMQGGAQQHLPAFAERKQPVEQRGADVADMQAARGGRREAEANGHSFRLWVPGSAGLCDLCARRVQLGEVRRGV